MLYFEDLEVGREREFGKRVGDEEQDEQERARDDSRRDDRERSDGTEAVIAVRVGMARTRAAIWAADLDHRVLRSSGTKRAFP